LVTFSELTSVGPTYNNAKFAVSLKNFKKNIFDPISNIKFERKIHFCFIRENISNCFLRTNKILLPLIELQ
jgi:hypothetical protein